MHEHMQCRAGDLFRNGGVMLTELLRKDQDFLWKMGKLVARML
uniref:Uncharacterized protein n=1 Tax=Arundo donax TaxID=35708 RepID=A0A0A9BDS0_ARUDO